MKELTAGLLGVPFDHGVKLSNGRPGARFGPQKVLRELSKLIKKKRLNVKVLHHGMVSPAKEDVLKTHERVAKIVKKIAKSNTVLIVIGGGHDISFASGKGIAQVYKKIGQINIDAHYDVRPVINGRISSGTPFRRLLEGKFLSGKNFVGLGVHSPKNLIEHRRYLKQKGATIIELKQINKLGIKKTLQKAFLRVGKGTKVSIFDIDIDGVQERFAPGCSAPCVKGFTRKQVLQSAYLAGKNKNVKLFNLMEISPPHDVKNKTVKLGAELIFNFVKGVNERTNNGY